MYRINGKSVSEITWRGWLSLICDAMQILEKEVFVYQGLGDIDRATAGKLALDQWRYLLHSVDGLNA